MKIRKMKKSDLRVCANFLAIAYTVSPFNEKWENDNAYKYLSHKFEYCHKDSYVITDKNNILGFVLLNLGYWADGPQVMIEEIVIKPEYQHQGLGSLLMEYVDSKLKKTKVKSVILWTHQDSSAYKFHQKHGFSLSHDLVLMDKNNQ